MSRSKRGVFCAMAVMVLVAAFSEAVSHAQRPVRSPEVLRPILPAPCPWAV